MPASPKAISKGQAMAQSAMEYLMTYGWSILIIAVVIAVLFSLGVFTPTYGAGVCIATPGFQCTQGMLTTAGSLAFTFGYAGEPGSPGALNISAIGCSNTTAAPTVGWSWVSVNSSPLYSGQKEKVIAPCNLNGHTRVGTPFSGTLWVQYVNGGTVQEQEVATVHYNTVSPVQPSVSQTLSVAPHPFAIAYDPGDGEMYVSCPNGASGNINAIIGTTITTNIPISIPSPYGLAYNPVNGDMYVVGNGGTVTDLVSGSTQVGSVGVGVNPWGVAYDPSDGYMYVANGGSYSVSVISGTQVISTIPVGGSGSVPAWVAYDPVNQYMYVTTYQGQTVYLISGTTLVGSISTGGALFGVAYDPSDGYMYASNYGNAAVVVISGNQIVANVPVGLEPEGIAYDPSDGDMYVDNFGSATVNVISGTTTIASIAVGTQPQGIAYDPINGDMYVANWGSGDVSILSGSP